MDAEGKHLQMRAVAANCYLAPRADRPLGGDIDVCIYWPCSDRAPRKSRKRRRRYPIQFASLRSRLDGLLCVGFRLFAHLTGVTKIIL